MTPTQPTSILIEAEGVLFHGGQALTGELAGLPSRKVFHSAAWLRHSRGGTTQRQAFETIGAALDVSAAAVADAVTAHTHSRRSPPGLPAMLEALTSRGRRLYCVALMPTAYLELARERMPGFVHSNRQRLFTGSAGAW
ncbi:hypothetical protein [Streptomyces sp. NPDC088760]|uniref:hypothetical protein n=1 Tax=Streptomyces sp. NPDC088760 TaxID=3365890 RepID=UPI00381668C3